MIVTWSHKANFITDRSQMTTAGSTTTLLIENPQASDADPYQCTFTNIANRWVLTRNIRLFITSTYVSMSYDT